LRAGRQAAFQRPAGIQEYMDDSIRFERALVIPTVSGAAVLLLTALCCGMGIRAQEAAPGAIVPPPEHHVTRIGTEVEVPAPPSLPPDEIIHRFAAKEDQNAIQRGHYSYRKGIRIQEFGPDGKVSGEFFRVTEVTPVGDGRVAVKTIEKPQSTLQHVYLSPEDVASLERVPMYPLTSNQLVNYELKYIGKEQVDEIDCYIFQVKPKKVERVKAYFDGIVWVDAKYLDLVKTYGKWVTDQGDQRLMPLLPFTLFETYRENVDGKYWFPNYSRADDTLQVKELLVPMRITIKWSDFKVPAPVVSASPSTPSSVPSPAQPAATEKPPR
jgi:hypothetical protein